MYVCKKWLLSPGTSSQRFFSFNLGMQFPCYVRIHTYVYMYVHVHVSATLSKSNSVHIHEDCTYVHHNMYIRICHMTDLFRKGLKRLAQEQLERVGAIGLDELERHFLKGELSLREQDCRFMVPACESKKKNNKKKMYVLVGL